MAVSRLFQCAMFSLIPNHTAGYFFSSVFKFQPSINVTQLNQRSFHSRHRTRDFLQNAAVRALAFSAHSTLSRYPGLPRRRKPGSAQRVGSQNEKRSLLSRAFYGTTPPRFVIVSAPSEFQPHPPYRVTCTTVKASPPNASGRQCATTIFGRCTSLDSCLVSPRPHPRRILL